MFFLRNKDDEVIVCRAWTPAMGDVVLKSDKHGRLVMESTGGDGYMCSAIYGYRMITREVACLINSDFEHLLFKSKPSRLQLLAYQFRNWLSNFSRFNDLKDPFKNYLTVRNDFLMFSLSSTSTSLKRKA